MRDTEERLLQALANPENYGITTEELCRRAGVARSSFYNIIKRPRFLKEYKTLRTRLIALVFPNIHSIARKCVEQALKGSFRHQKLVFEMVGLLKPKIGIDFGLNVQGEVSQPVELIFESFRRAIQPYRDNPELRKQHLIKINNSKFPEAVRAELKKLEYKPEKNGE
jgi:hypothetical protein